MSAEPLKLFTGTGGVPPASSRESCQDLAKAQLPKFCSRCALIAGWPPALPVKSLSAHMQVTTKGLLAFTKKSQEIYTQSLPCLLLSDLGSGLVECFYASAL
jgi:hypothetical protein